MSLAVLDASVVIAFRDPADALNARAVAAFHEHSSADFVMPASVYAEVLVAPMRHGPPAVASLDAFIDDLGIQIAPATREIARQAAALRAANPSLRLPDAFVLATGVVPEAAVALTGDAAWARFNTRAHVI